jgi:Nif-specific regulatory protein
MANQTMQAELIVVSGPLLGERFPLGPGETRIGRAPTADIQLTEPNAAWVHCIVRAREGRCHIVDRRSSMGTFVNGMRIGEHWLEPGDQVGICETVLLYREDRPEPAPDSPHLALVLACSFLFLFRAIAMAKSGAHRATLEGQLVRLIGDIVPSSGGAVLLGRDADELRSAARELPGPVGLAEIAARACREGAVADPAALVVALALYVRGAIVGVLAAWFPPEEAAHLSDHRDTLSAIATLAATALETVHEMERLQAENALLLERLGTGDAGIVGESPAIRKLLQLIARVAPRETSVLILGESGTGKELVARALHRQSARSAKPFVAINCAALTETLLESELFGHEKGAFTGAVEQKKGKLEMAEGGTVFLDEIGELAPALQAKLLRVVQQREFERVGGTRTLKLDVRLIAATNRDLNAEVRRGAFREDLYHRLNVVALHVPPLRDHAEDIPALARHFLEQAAVRCRRRVSTVSPEAECYLTSYSWPGNVRELENAVERAVVLGQSDVLLPEDLPETVLESAIVPEVPGALQSSVTENKRQLIMEAWRQSNGDHNLAAARLHIHPNSLRRLIRSLHLRDVLQ